MERTDETFRCPNCGADVPEDAPACPECGADDETGWSDDTAYDDLDLPGLDDQPVEPPGPLRAGLWLGLALAMACLIAVLAVLGVWG
jgi:hypothetical protein